MARARCAGRGMVMMKADRDYGVKVTKPFSFRRVGQVFYPTGALRIELIKRGLVEPVKPPESEKPTRKLFDRK